jgi:hypothetical protein
VILQLFRALPPYLKVSLLVVAPNPASTHLPLTRTINVPDTLPPRVLSTRKPTSLPDRIGASDAGLSGIATCACMKTEARTATVINDSSQIKICFRIVPSQLNYRNQRRVIHHVRRFVSRCALPKLLVQSLTCAKLKQFSIPSIASNAG